MTIRLSILCKVSIISFQLMYSVTSLSEVKLEKAEKCIYINSNINRLACFDEIFNTPIRKQIVDERALNNFYLS